jgi:membrane associated rhomboid family serine protease
MASKRVISIADSFIVSGAFLLLLWVIHFLTWLLGLDFGFLGVQPRTLGGLIGIVTMPLIHGDWGHLISNSVPMLSLGAAIVFFYPRIALKGIGWMWVGTGLLTWIAGRGNSSHIGASGLIYAFAAFLFFSGVFRRDTAAVVVALLVAMFYGSMVWGVFPSDPRVSWEGHLMGGLMGIFIAWMLRKQNPMPKKQYSWEREPEVPTAPDDNPYWDYPKDPPPWTRDE